jgi:hypothetical protein
MPELTEMTRFATLKAAAEDVLSLQQGLSVSEVAYDMFEHEATPETILALLSALEEAREQLTILEQLVCDFQAAGMIDVAGMNGPCEVKPIHIENHVIELRAENQRLLLNQEKAVELLMERGLPTRDRDELWSTWQSRVASHREAISLLAPSDSERSHE